MATHLINRIAIHATAETALPTLPASAGSNVSKASWTTAGYETIRGTNLQTADNYDIDEEPFNIETEVRTAEIMPPIGLGIDEELLISQKILPVEMTLFDVAEGLWTLASNITVSSNVAELTESLTPRAVAFEIYNTAMIWMPNANVYFSGIEMGAVEGQIAKTKLTVKPLNTSSIPGGFNIEWY